MKDVFLARVKWLLSAAKLGDLKIFNDGCLLSIKGLRASFDIVIPGNGEVITIPIELYLIGTGVESITIQDMITIMEMICPERYRSYYTLKIQDARRVYITIFTNIICP